MGVCTRPIHKVPSFRSAVFTLSYLALCLYPLASAIVLEFPIIEAHFDVQIAESDFVSPSELIPICDLSIIANHRGSGQVSITHTPLSNSRESVMYRLVADCDVDFEAGETFTYVAGHRLNERIELGRIWARVSTLPRGTLSSYTSTLRLNLISEL